jgi:ATP-dependent DNA helicase RecG
VKSAEIEERLRLGEDGRTEFKSVHRAARIDEPLAKAIVALANGQGGEVFLGVADDGTPEGLTIVEADALMRQVSQICADQVSPALYCPILKAEVRGALLLVVRVPSFSPDRPYRSIHGKGWYIRDGSQSRALERHDLLRLAASTDYHFDEQPVEGAEPDALDREVVREFLAHVGYEGGTPEQYLRPLRCADERGVPTVAGILMFGAEPGRWLPDAHISAVRFRGAAVSGDFVDRKEIEGRLSRQIEEAAAFLDRHLAPARIEGWERKDGGIPERALREALLNAVAHRDYRAPSQIKIFVFDDRVEIINPGGLLNQLSLDSIRLAGTTQHRNRTLAALLARSRRRESLGMGIPEMIRLVRDRGLPEPELDVQGGHFRVVLRARPAEGT